MCTAVICSGDTIADLIERGTYVGDTIDDLIEKATYGDADAQYVLGIVYYEDGGVGDYGKVVYWLTQAAEQGHVMAQASLGNIYHEGKVVGQDDEKAVYWWMKAAEQGNVWAQGVLNYLGMEWVPAAKPPIVTTAQPPIVTTAKPPFVAIADLVYKNLQEKKYLRDQNLGVTGELADYMVIKVSEPNDVGFYAVALKKGNDVTLAYRGSDEWPDWNLANFPALIEGASNQDWLAYQFARQVVMANPGTNFYVTGHSLGGRNALIGAAAILQVANDSLIEVHTYNRLGLSRPNLLDEAISDKLQEHRIFMGDIENMLEMNPEKIFNHCNELDLACRTGRSYGKMECYASDKVSLIPIAHHGLGAFVQANSQKTDCLSLEMLIAYYYGLGAYDIVEYLFLFGIDKINESEFMKKVVDAEIEANMAKVNSMVGQAEAQAALDRLGLPFW